MVLLLVMLQTQHNNGSSYVGFYVSSTTEKQQPISSTREIVISIPFNLMNFAIHRTSLPETEALNQPSSPPSSNPPSHLPHTPLFPHLAQNPGRRFTDCLAGSNLTVTLNLLPLNIPPKAHPLIGRQLRRSRFHLTRSMSTALAPCLVPHTCHHPIPSIIHGLNLFIGRPFASSRF
jgi:hypothetical protein